MKMKVEKLETLGLATLALLVVSSCSSTSKTKEPTGAAETTTMVATQHGVPGGVFVATYQTTATVTAIDGATRKVTLVGQDGNKTVVKAGPEVVNFKQIQVGDQVKATITEKLVVFMGNSAPRQTDGVETTVAVAPLGAKPGALVADTVQVTAKVTAIDIKKHKATLAFPDGSTQTVAVRQDVDLAQRKVGEEVVIRCTESIALAVNKP